jgi:putative ABC transport system permease protein
MAWHHGLRMRLRWLFRRRAVEDELQEELRFHVEREAAHMAARGRSESAARREARLHFGGVDRFTEEARQHWTGALWRDVGRDVAYALRTLRRAPVHALSATLTIALGCGAAAAVFGIADASLWRRLPLPDGDRILLLDGSGNLDAPGRVSYPGFRDWQEHARFFDAMAAAFFTRRTWLANGDPEPIAGAVVTQDFDRVAGVHPLAGSMFSSLEAGSLAGKVMISESFWKERFASDAGVIGRTIVLDNEPQVILGVLPDAAGLLLEADWIDVWVPLIPDGGLDRNMHFLRVVGRLREDVTHERAHQQAAALDTVLTRINSANDHMALRSLRDQVLGHDRELLFLLSGAIAFLLLVVCANLANLQLAQVQTRHREFLVRASLGAMRPRLIRQVLIESMVVCAIGGTMGVVSALLLQRMVRNVTTGAALLSSTGLDLRIIAFTVALSLFIGVAFGVVPALRAGGAHSVLHLSGRGVRGRSPRGSLDSLLAAEIALTLVLLVGTGLMTRSMTRLVRQDPGFDASNLLVLDLELDESYDRERARAFWDDLLTRSRALPGVVHAGLGLFAPLSGGEVEGTIEIPGRTFPPDQVPEAAKRIVSPGYFEALRIRLQRGRTFNEAERADSTRVAIVSESFARRHFPRQDAIGQRIRFRWGTTSEQEIVGVVADVKGDLGKEAAMTVYVPDRTYWRTEFSLFVRTAGDPSSLIGPTRAVVRSLDPKLAVQRVRTMLDIRTESVAKRRAFANMLSGFTFVALIIALVGVYGVTARTVSARTPEIGVRMALGATSGGILRLFLREKLLVLSVGVSAGLLLAFATTRYLRAMLFSVSETDELSFAGAAAALALAVLVASWLPARQGARLDPAVTLRAE